MGDYRALKLDCMSRGQLYEDHDFPPLASSIYHSKRVLSDIRWARPKAVCDNAEFVSSIGSTLDLHPGLADNPGFSCAASLVALQPALFKKVVLPGQDFGARYIGIFRFNIWHCGEWREVVIDDRVPIRDNQPAFCRNRKQPSEFWCALLEKAYAKVHGSYEALESLQAQDVLVDLTGGVADVIDMPMRPPKGLFQVMAIFHTMNTIMACTIPAGGSKHGGEHKKGLSSGATYLVSNVLEKSQPGRKNKDRFIFIRDTRQRNSDSIQQLPWINDGFHGNTNNKNELCLPYRSWKKHFGHLILCHLSVDGQLGDGAKRRWHVSSERGLWERGRSAGGCGNPPDEELYWTNPQFVMQLKPGGCSGREQMLMVSVLQKPVGWGAEGPPSRSAISIDIYKLLEAKEDRTKDGPFEKTALELVRSTEAYCDLREVTLRTTLPVGRYVIIPSTYLPDECSEFLLRTVTETRAHLRCIHGSPTPDRSSLASPHLSEMSSLEIIYGIGRQGNYQNQTMTDKRIDVSQTKFVDGLSEINDRLGGWRQGPISPPEPQLSDPPWSPATQRATQVSRSQPFSQNDDRTMYQIQEAFFSRTVPKQRSKPLKRRKLIGDVTLMLTPGLQDYPTSDSESSAPPSPPTRQRGNMGRPSEPVSTLASQRGNMGSPSEPVSPLTRQRGNMGSPSEPVSPLTRQRGNMGSPSEPVPPLARQRGNMGSPSEPVSPLARQRGNMGSPSEPVSPLARQRGNMGSPSEPVSPLARQRGNMGSPSEPVSPLVRHRGNVSSQDEPVSPLTRERGDVSSPSERSDQRTPVSPLTVDVQDPQSSTRLTVHDIHHTLLTAGMLGEDRSTNIETCRNLMAMVDPRGYATIDSQTTAPELWDQISTWQEAFVCMTSDVHQNLHSEDLADALQLVDVDVGEGGLRALVCRYSGEDGSIKYVDFLSCVARCKAAWDRFQCHRIGESRSSCLTIDQWMESFLR